MFVKCRRSYVRNSWELMFHSLSGKDCMDLEPSGGGNNNKMPRRHMSTGCFVSYLEEGDRKQLIGRLTKDQEVTDIWSVWELHSAYINVFFGKFETSNSL